MPRVVAALFCEKVHVLRDGKHFAAGIFPGLVALPAPPGGTAYLDLLVMLAPEVPGPGRVDLSLTGPDGRQLMYDSVAYQAGDVRAQVQVVVSNIALTPDMRGTLVARVRPEGGDWAEAGRIVVEAQAGSPPAITGHFGYAP